METRKALNLLKQALDEMPNLRTQTPDRQNYQEWLGKIRNILDLKFTTASREYVNFTRAVSSDYIVNTEKEKQKKYNEELDAYENALKSAIHKCELLVEEEKRSETEGLNKEKHNEIVIKEENRKNLKGQPEEITPHITRVAESLKIEKNKYKVIEESYNSTQFSKRLRIMCGSEVDVLLVSLDEPYPDRHDIGTITLQSLPSNETLFISKRLPSSFDSNGAYFDSFLERLSLELKNLGIEETKTKKTWRWFNKILDIWAKVKP